MAKRPKNMYSPNQAVNAVGSAVLLSVDAKDDSSQRLWTRRTLAVVVQQAEDFSCEEAEDKLIIVQALLWPKR